MNKSKLISFGLFLSILFVSYFFIQSKKKISTTLSKKEQEEIIDVHNQWRAEVGVDNLKWSDELASVAQKWANKLAKQGCRMKHSKSPYGENIYWSSFASTPKEAVDEWGTEKKYYHGRKIKASKVHKYGHYTQMVWRKSKLVGCGRAKCKRGGEIWVCNYSPAGNIIGEYAYKK